jgi:hypothetical protein
MLITDRRGRIDEGLEITTHDRNTDYINISTTNGFTNE